MNIQCSSCNALHWHSECMQRIRLPTFEDCCKKGKVILPRLEPLPPVLDRLFTQTSSEASAFRTNIRQYNSAIAFTSCMYQKDVRLGSAVQGVQTFQIHGELFHLQGPLTPLAESQPLFAQVYFYDPRAIAANLSRQRPQINEELLTAILQELHTVNPYIRVYKTARERLQQEPDGQRAILNPQLRLVIEKGADKRRENLPTSDEIAIIIPDEYDQAGICDIILAERDDRSFHTINPNNAAYMPLHYVLLFPRGEPGWH